MKVVLDTNILIEGLKDDYSYEKRIIDEVRKGNLIAYANHSSYRENRLITRQLINSVSYKKELEDFFKLIHFTSGRLRLDIVADHEDNKILASAVEAGAEYLVTSDKDLLTIGSYQGVQIVSPARFWQTYMEEDGGAWAEWTKFIMGQK